MPAVTQPPQTFRIKAALLVALVVLADRLFVPEPAELGVGLFAVAVVAALLIAHPAVRRDPRAAACLAIAAGLALLLIERPNPILWLMFWTAATVAALSPRAALGEDVWRWAQRLVVAGLKALPGPVLDASRLGARRLRRRPRQAGLAAGLAALALPLAGGLVFVALFAGANPLIERALAAVRLPSVSPGRVIFWIVAGLALWGLLRPRGLRRTLAAPDARTDLRFVGVSPASVTLSLVVFNLLFAVQNALDLAFLWSGAPLPDGVTLAEYAHRGAYLLIVTALLAAAFVLFALRPGSETASRPAVRGLVIAWVAQTLVLVASSVLRTLDYVQAYSLTELRIAALAWMGLVALGLVLICVRLLRGKSSSWLINLNAAAAGAVILVLSVADLGALAAAWNVRHAREVDGDGAALDLCYMQRLGPAALVPLVELEGQPLPPDLYERVVSVRRSIMLRTAQDQAAWRTWSWRDQRRLDTASARLGDRPPPPPHLRPRACHPHTTEVAPPAPLTPAAQPGT